MSSKRTYIATFWRSNLQLKNGTALLKRMHSRCGEKRYSWNSIKRSGF